MPQERLPFHETVWQRGWDIQTLRRELSDEGSVFPMQSALGQMPQAAQGVQPLVRNAVTQNSPDLQTIRAVCSAGRTCSRQESIEVRPYWTNRNVPVLSLISE